VTPALDTYLKRATGGLPRRARAEAQAELRSHVHERAQELQQAGSSPEAALGQAMTELGPPQTVARSLNRAHHVHPALSAIAMTALVGFFGLGLQTYLTAERKAYVDELQGRIWFRGNSDETDMGQNRAARQKQGLLTRGELKEALRNSGATLSGDGEATRLSLAGVPDLSLADTHILTYQRLSETRVSQPLYVAMDLLPALAQHQWPVQLIGWGMNSQLKLAGRQIHSPEPFPEKLPRAAQRATEQLQNAWALQTLASQRAYSDLSKVLQPPIVPALAWEGPPSMSYPANLVFDSNLQGTLDQPILAWHPTNANQGYLLKTKLRPGHLYALSYRHREVISYWPAGGQLLTLHIIVGEADQTGQLKLTIVNSWSPGSLAPLQLMPDLETFRRAPLSAVHPALLTEVPRDFSQSDVPLNVIRTRERLQPEQVE
jgi:hypothetical protein